MAYNLKPRTREENLMGVIASNPNAEAELDTRQDAILAKVPGITPKTRTEAFLADIAENGGGTEPTGTITITANGEGIDVSQYATADVNVPASAVTSGTKSITANGSVDVTAYKTADVSVQPTFGTVSVQNNSSATIFAYGYDLTTNGLERVATSIASGETKSVKLCGYKLSKTDRNQAILSQRWGVSDVLIISASSGNKIAATANCSIKAIMNIRDTIANAQFSIPARVGYPGEGAGTLNYPSIISVSANIASGPTTELVTSPKVTIADAAEE